MRARHLFADGVGRILDVPLAKEADHFQEVGFAQGDSCAALWTGNLLSEVAVIKANMNATGGTGHFMEFRRLGLARCPPNPKHRSTTAKQEI